MKIRGSMKTVKNDLLIGGCLVSDLKEKYGTPLYILDQEYLEDTCKVFVDNFKSDTFKTVVAYASKAMLNIPLAQVLTQEGMHFDVASQGEIYVLKQAKVPMEHIYFHGNNKTMEELRYAVEVGVGVIVLDNHQEAVNLELVLNELKKNQKVLLRINPGIETDTHKYIQTSSLTSKFGESVYDSKTKVLISNLLKSEWIQLKGFHSHIGSQIFDKTSFFEASKAVFNFYQEIEKEYSVVFDYANLGGGFGVYYSHGDKPFAMKTFLEEYIQLIENEIKIRNLKIKKVTIEPGRSVINDVVSTLYTVGSIKETYGGKNYMFVDGGMSDNIRPALYEAKYEAFVVNSKEEKGLYTVAGKLCESGDVLIEEIELDKAEKDDLLLIPASGAYTYSMSSNYNKALRPAIVSVMNGKETVFVRRETLEDLIVRDQTL